MQHSGFVDDESGTADEQKNRLEKLMLEQQTIISQLNAKEHSVGERKAKKAKKAKAAPDAPAAPAPEVQG